MKIRETSPVVMPVHDAVLEEVWLARRTLSEAAGHDIARLFAGARERQRKSGRPSVSFEKTGT